MKIAALFCAFSILLLLLGGCAGQDAEITVTTSDPLAAQATRARGPFLGCSSWEKLVGWFRELKAQGKSVILSTHILPEVQAICERVLVINNGTIVADGRAAELGARVDGVRRLNVRITGDVKTIAPVLRAIDGMKSVDILGEKESGSCDYQLTSAPGIDIRQPLFHALEKAGAAILEMRDAGASLEDIFVKLTAEDEAAKAKGGRQKSKKKEENN